MQNHSDVAPERPVFDQYGGATCLELALRADEHWPFYDEDEISAVAAVLRSGRVNQWTGPEVFQFERCFSRRFGGGNSIALANGSLALELALRAFGVGPGDEVVVSPRSFVASAACVRLVGATPVFADVDSNSGNITTDTVASVLTGQTRAIIPVHLAGWPADIPGIVQLVGGRNIKVIEDCAQAHGAEIQTQSVGTFGDAAAWSFCQDKIISTGGEGGVVTFKDQSAWDWARSFKDHGKNFPRATVSAGEPGMFRLIHDQIGTNWRLSGPQAAIGLIQLKKLKHWRAVRAENVKIWTKALTHVRGLKIPMPPGNSLRHAFYKLYSYVDVGSDRDAACLRAEILKRSAEAGLRVFSGTCSEIYLEKAFADLPPPSCPVSRSLGARSIMLEVHPTLRQDLLNQRAARLAEIAGEVLSGT